MTSLTQQKSNQNYEEKDISPNLNQKCLIFLQQDSTRVATQYEINNHVTMATYWVPDFPDVAGYSCHFRHYYFDLSERLLVCMISQTYLLTSIT